MKSQAKNATTHGEGYIYCIYTLDPNDTLKFCATFREMLEALHFFAQYLHPTPDSKIAATIKKAEEML